MKKRITIDLEELFDKIADAVASASNEVIDVDIKPINRVTIGLNRDKILSVIQQVKLESSKANKKTSGWLFYYLADTSLSLIASKNIGPHYIYTDSEDCPKKLCRYKASTGPFSDSSVDYYTVFIPNTERTVEDKSNARKRADHKFLKAQHDGKLPKKFQEVN